MAKLVYWNKENNHEYTDVFLRLLPEVSVFLDIGASIGYYSIVAKTAFPEIEVYAFEPAAGPYHYLQRNFELNGVARAQAHNIAVSDGQGSVSFYAPFNPKYSYLKHHLGGDGSLLDRPEDQHLRETTVETKSLDALIEELGITGIELIKIDTEATEDRVLSGGTESIARFRPIIVSEVLFDKIETKLDEILSSWDYLIYEHTDYGLRRRTRLSRSTDDGVRNFFFVPVEKQLDFETRVGSLLV